MRRIGTLLLGLFLGMQFVYGQTGTDPACSKAVLNFTPPPQAWMTPSSKSPYGVYTILSLHGNDAYALIPGNRPASYNGRVILLVVIQNEKTRERFVQHLSPLVDSAPYSGNPQGVYSVENLPYLKYGIYFLYPTKAGWGLRAAMLFAPSACLDFRARILQKQIWHAEKGLHIIGALNLVTYLPVVTGETLPSFLVEAAELARQKSQEVWTASKSKRH